MQKKAKAAVTIGVFALAMTLIGNVIGVAFSTGREIMTYFADFGRIGLVGIVISFSLMFIFAPMSYATSRNMDKYTFDWIVTPLGWKPLRMFNLYFTLIGLFSSVSAMIAGTGSILEALFGVPYLVGALFMVAACIFTACFSLKRFSDTLSIMVPIMVVLAIVICVICAVWPNVEGNSWDSVSSSNILISNWLVSALVYFGINVGPVIQLVCPMSKDIKDKKTIRTAAVLSAVILMVVAGCVAIAIVRNYSISSEAVLPTITMAYVKSPIAGILYGVVAIIAIYSTCAAFLHIFKASFNNIKPLKDNPLRLNVTLTVLALVAFAASFIGFANFVDKVWAVLGYFAYIAIAGVTFNYFYYKKHPQNRLTAVDNAESAPMPAGADEDSSAE